MKLLRWMALAGFVAVFSGTAVAADIARLEWGAFIIETDSANGWNNYKAVASDDGRSIKMTFSPFEAKADGSTLEASANLAGHFELTQPNYDRFTKCVATVEGLIIKSEASSVRLVIKAGSSEQVIEWGQGKQLSERFSRDIEIALPGEGRLPNPFPVSIQAFVKKDGASDAAYVSVESLTITAGGTKVAAN